MLEELYQDAIIESARSTAYRGTLSDRKGALNILVHNPLCGDQVQLWIDAGALESTERTEGCSIAASPDGRESCINCARFSGHGCSISQAAASMLCKAVEGKSPEEAAQLVEDFKALLSGAADEKVRERLGEIVSLEGVRRFPARARCASIAFEALASVLRRDEQTVIATGC